MLYSLQWNEGQYVKFELEQGADELCWAFFKVLIQISVGIFPHVHLALSL